MSPQHAELERLVDCLRGMVTEHRRLLDLVIRQEKAMRTMDAAALEQIAPQQEHTRTRIMQWDGRRKSTVAVLARAAKLPAEPNIARLATAHPTHRLMLLNVRDELKAVATEVASRTGITSRIAQSMLGHLNTAVRLLASAVERGGTYTRQGAPKLTRRIGSIEAVG